MNDGDKYLLVLLRDPGRWPEVDSADRERLAKALELTDTFVRKPVTEFTDEPCGLTWKELATACRNLDVDLNCGSCASVFFTGGCTNPHTCSRYRVCGATHTPDVGPYAGTQFTCTDVHDYEDSEHHDTSSVSGATIYWEFET